ncbi:MAG: hypothetical protein K2P26_08765 [Oscillospiraceae bacterium]|nr:hypothetical protein [Oscillospiraceae bacterium]
MKRMSALLLTLLLAFSLTACGGAPAQNTPAAGTDTPASTPAGGDTTTTDDSSEPADDRAGDSKILVAVFSLPGEHYGVGIIEEGNTAIIADMIVEQTGADLFRIENVRACLISQRVRIGEVGFFVLQSKKPQQS